uniref:Charged multivesicular body protein 4b n=1 Tax=Leersia perrieri TaxID=77586 RepID=A0A0D9XNK0_9ORYZ
MGGGKGVAISGVGMWAGGRPIKPTRPFSSSNLWAIQFIRVAPVERQQQQRHRLEAAQLFLPGFSSPSKTAASLLGHSRFRRRTGEGQRGRASSMRATLEMLEKKECFLQKKASAEVEKAKDYTKSKNKSAAIQCLKKKKLYETQIEQLANFQLRVHDQIIMLESAKATTDTVDALRSGSSAVKAIHQSVSIDDIENAIEEANEHTENMRQIQEALATPIGASADFDEDELEAELEDLEEEELENELPEPPLRTSIVPSARATTSSQPANDLAELTKLQAEMAL